MTRDRKITVVAMIAVPVLLFGHALLNLCVWAAIVILVAFTLLFLLAPAE